MPTPGVTFTPIRLDESVAVQVGNTQVRVSRATAAYLSDLITDCLMHDGSVRYPVTLRLAPGVARELESIGDSFGAVAL